MKETYLSRDFRETAAQRFPTQAKQLNAAFDARLNALLAENAGASKEKQYHLKRQILPGIAAYETLQRVMPKEEALQTVHGYVERLARTSHKQLAALLHIPGIYRLVPGVFVKSTRSVFSQQRIQAHIKSGVQLLCLRRKALRRSLPKVTGKIGFLPLHRPLPFLFVPAVAVGSAGGKGVLPRKICHTARFAHGVVQTAQSRGQVI